MAIDKRRMIKQAGILTLIVCVSTVLLTFTYALTNPIIEKNREDRIENNINLIFPEMERKELRPAYDEGRKVGDYYAAYDSYDRIIGYVAVQEQQGYQSTIRMLVGISPSKDRVESIVILEQQETPGLGTKIEKDWFVDQFMGVGKNEIALTREGGSIDAISGATISSQAVVSGVNESIGWIR